MKPETLNFIFASIFIVYWLVGAVIGWICIALYFWAKGEWKYGDIEYATFMTFAGGIIAPWVFPVVVFVILGDTWVKGVPPWQLLSWWRAGRPDRNWARAQYDW